MKLKRILISLLVFANFQIAYSQDLSLVSGDVTLRIEKADGGNYYVTYSAYGETLNSNVDKNPTLYIDTNKEFYFLYKQVEQKDDRIVASAEVVASPSTVVFSVKDEYKALGNGEFELLRSVMIKDLGEKPYQNGFYSSFGLQLPNQNILDCEYFIPSVMYRGNFLKEGNLPENLPQATDVNFSYREDRLPLPVAMCRRKSDGLTLTVINKDSKCKTTLNDSKGILIDGNYLFGGVGFLKRKDNNVTAVVTFPGNDSRKGGLGERRHPIDTDFNEHNYKVYYKISETESYAEAVDSAWNLCFKLYNPSVYYENQTEAYKSIVETVNTYYLAPPSDVKGPGFPWSVDLKDFSLNKNTYELGFVGAQPVAGYALFRAGVEFGNKEYESRGNQVLNFWALKSLSQLGLPKSRYAALNGTWDSWAYTSIRQACNGMAGILNAWAFAKRNGINRPAWLAACKQFGDFLVENQNSDGSFYLEYQPFNIVDGKHPAGNQNKYTTTCSLRYLVELYIATGDERYKETALKAAEFCYQNVHQQYLYVACVIDNPQTIDSESGQQALNGFLAVYDLTKDPKWLDAAEQAAVYTASWTYMYDVPVEVDQTEETDWPKDRSIIGQHIIAIGHSGADLGFAWSSFVYYRLYLLTGKQQYLHIARVSAHNSKLSMNLRQELYPGQPEGLQQEAFTVRTSENPRRTNSVMQALTWNFAAHLDPMIRFKDTFGTYDIEEVEKLPKDEVLKMNERYSRFQSSDYGQDASVDEICSDVKIAVRGQVVIVKGFHQKVEVINMSGQLCYVGENTAEQAVCDYDLGQFLSGCYLLKIYGKDSNIQCEKIFI